MRFYSTRKCLLETIESQDEIIDKLYKERMELYIVIRNETPIRIDHRGLDYMVDLEQKYYNLQSIIEEAREYVKQLIDLKKEDYLKSVNLIYIEKILEILEILDKANK